MAATTILHLLAPQDVVSISTPQSAGPTSARSSASAAIHNVILRFRPRPSLSVEAALDIFIRRVFRDRQARVTSQAINANLSTGVAGVNASADIQRFFDNLQGDLLEAFRVFAGPVTSIEASMQASSTIEPTSTSSPSSSEPDGVGDTTTTAEPNPPTFHHQLGQITPNPHSSTDVTGGLGGVPRHLNFVRAHAFPEVPSGDLESSPDPIVSCIFITVRSVRHHEILFTEDMVQDPAFPSSAGEVTSPPNESRNDSGSSSLTATGNVLAPDPQEAISASGRPAFTPVVRPSLRQRFRRRFASRPVPRTTGSPDFFLVSVRGGNYPRSHPILAIPSLLTGGPLTNEEMQLIGELLGQAKPPTASVDEIEKAGLKVFDGSEMAILSDKGEVLDSCVERCLVSDLTLLLRARGVGKGF